MKDLSWYEAGQRPVEETTVLMLISEMEGTYQHLKFMGFYDDMKVIEEMKPKYYKLYFRLKREAKERGSVAE